MKKQKEANPESDGDGLKLINTMRDLCEACNGLNIEFTKGTETKSCHTCTKSSTCQIFKLSKDWNYGIKCSARSLNKDNAKDALIFELKNSGLNVHYLNDDMTTPHTRYGVIEVFEPDKEILSRIYKILERYRKHFFFTESITDAGFIHIWIHGCKKSVRDRVNWILNGGKHKEKEDGEK